MGTGRRLDHPELSGAELVLGAAELPEEKPPGRGPLRGSLDGGFPERGSPVQPLERHRQVWRILLDGRAWAQGQA
ncbi:MAG: hypothetical protein WCF33_25365 [Pseudonocardiaceae bacterium]